MMQVPTQKVDAIVVGAGPAGSSAAIRLAQQGFQVTLLDRASFPRDKACGEFLTPETRPLLESLGAWETVQSAGLRQVHATVLVAPNGREMRYRPDANGAGYTIRRVALDAALLRCAESAGVTVCEGVALRELLRNDAGAVAGVRVRTAEGETRDLPSRLVIGADGSHSLVARQLNLVRALPRLQRVAVVSHWQDVSGAGDTIEMRTHGELVCGIGFPGTTSSGNIANLTLVVPTSLASRIAGRTGEFVEETLQSRFPDLAARLAGATREATVRTVGCFGHISRPSVADGALLVGDAATFIDPFTGEGVYFGLRGAQLAAEFAGRALHANDTSCPRLLPYHHARRELGRRYLLCDLVQRIVRTPSLLNQVVQRMDRYPPVAERLFAILGDTRPPTDALHPAFLWKLLAPGL